MSAPPLLIMMLARRLRRLPRPGVRCVSEAELNPNRELGFSFPAPRVLGEIAKVDLLRQEDPDAIRDIWRKHHEGSENALATDLAAEDFRTILARGKERCAPSGVGDPLSAGHACR